MATQDQLISMLDALEAALPGLIENNPDPGDFWAVFADEADIIEDQAGEHGAMVGQRIQAMLAEHGRYLAMIG